MHLQPLLLALPLTAAAPLLRRADYAPEVLAEISTLSSDVSSLTDAVNAFSSNLLALLPDSLAVITAETKLDAQIQKTTATVEKSDAFNDTESGEITQALANLVTPIQDSLTALEAKYPTFKSTIIEAPLVLLDLKTLKSHTDALTTAIEAKVTSTYVSLLQAGAQIIDSAFDDAIAVYEGEGTTSKL